MIGKHRTSGRAERMAQRRIIKEMKAAGLTYPKIADHLGCSAKNVATIYVRMRRRGEL
jgi:DNA-directed RNA polymerase specialized sigma24 family protein